MMENTPTILRCLFIVAKALPAELDEAGVLRIYEEVKQYPVETALVMALKKMGWQGKKVAPGSAGLAESDKPAIALMLDGEPLVILKVMPAKVLFVDPATDKPLAVSKEEFAQRWSGELILPRKPFRLKELGKTFNLGWFVPIILRYKLYFGEIVVMSCCLQIFGLTTPLFTQVIIDKVIPHNGESTLTVLAAALLILAVFQLVMGMLRTYVSNQTTNKIDVILAARMFRQIVTLPLRYFEVRRVGDILMRIAGLNSIREFFTGSSISVLLDSVFSLLFIAVMLFYSWPLTLLALLAMPLYLGQNILATPVYRKRLETVWAAGANNNALLVESVTGMQTIKALALEPQFNHRWETLLSRYVRTNFDTAVFNLALSNSSQLIQKLSALSILWFGGRLVMEGSMTIGQLVAFQMLSSQVNQPMLRLVGMWQTFQRTALAVDRLQDIINQPPEPAALSEPPRSGVSIAGEVVFEQVNFRYFVDTDRVLKELNLRIPAGAKVGIVGPSGSGKSTLTKLIQRLYMPETGRVMIDGNDLAGVSPGWLRRQIGIVLQDSYLFSGSVRDNIAAAWPAAPMEEVIRATRAAAAHDFILELPDGYDTDVGERGSFLSGGQRQRIAIARTLLTNPRILVLDEATSALDYESERIFMDNLAQLYQDRTVIMIAHRLSTVQHADFIVVLDRGRIVEIGAHLELLALQGLYHSLHQQQEG